MKNDWLNPEWHIHNIDAMLESLEKIFDKSKDDNERLKILDQILKWTKLKTRVMNMMTKS